MMRRIDQEVAQVHSSCNAQSLLSVFCRTYASFLLEKEKNKRENTFYIKLIFYRKGILEIHCNSRMGGTGLGFLLS